MAQGLAEWLKCMVLGTLGAAVLLAPWIALAFKWF